MDNFNSYISINPDVRFGKPCIRGTRIAIADILTWLSAGMSMNEIIADYPVLNEEQIKAVRDLLHT